MTVLFAIFLVVHGLIHLMGAAKAFGVAEIPQLAQQISRPLGVLWLLAAGLLLVTAGALFTWPRWWWTVGAGAIVISQVAIATSWSDAKYGSIANVIVLVGVVLGLLSQGPSSFRAEYEREVGQSVGHASATPVLTEADIAHLPAAVQQYIRFTGSVGQPRVQNFRAGFHGKIRSGPDSRWMSFTGEQYNSYDQPSRLFLMDASMFGVPFQAFHRLVGPSATMRVKVASIVQVVDAKGPEMDESETVTLFNDLCVFAPGALVDRGIQWQEIDPHTVSALFANASHTIRAVLSHVRVAPDHERGRVYLARARWQVCLLAIRPRFDRVQRSGCAKAAALMRASQLGVGRRSACLIHQSEVRDAKTRSPRPPPLARASGSRTRCRLRRCWRS